MSDDAASGAHGTFPSIDGVDVQGGLRRVVGRETLYRQLLTRYVDAQRDAPERIERAWIEARLDDAVREAHTLKGVSAQLGIEGVRGAAEALEHALRRREPVSTLLSLKDAVVVSLAAVIDAIELALSSAPPPAAAAAAPVIAWHDVRARLESLLATDDMACLRLLEAQRDVVKQALGEDFGSFERSVRDFDFSNALRLLRLTPLNSCPDVE